MMGRWCPVTRARWSTWSHLCRGPGQGSRGPAVHPGATSERSPESPRSASAAVSPVLGGGWLIERRGRLEPSPPTAVRRQSRVRGPGPGKQLGAESGLVRHLSALPSVETRVNLRIRWDRASLQYGRRTGLPTRLTPPTTDGVAPTRPIPPSQPERRGHAYSYHGST